MIDPADIVTLRVAGKDYAGWTGIDSIRSGLDCIAGGFSVALTEKWMDATYRPIHKEDAVDLLIGTQTVVKGFIDEVGRELADGTHTITVTGRDATSDLVDCSAMNTPGEWIDRDIAAIAAAIAGPFGVKIAVAPGASTGRPYKTFTLQKGEKAFAAIQRLCAARGLLPYSDGRGVLVLGPGTPARVPTRLVEGVNIKKIGVKDTRIGRFRDYTVWAQSAMWGEAGANAGTKGTAHDAGIRRYRPTARMADDLADGITASQQAAWEAMVAKAKALAVPVTVAGWRHAGGLWRPNTLVTIDAPTVGLMGAQRLIASVDFSLSGTEGNIAQLTTVGPGAFALLAEKEGGSVKW